MTHQHHHSHHEHGPTKGDKDPSPRNTDGNAPAPPSDAPDMKTVYSPDGQYKIVAKAWKDYWFFYNSIGAEVDVYRRQETRDTWGNKTIDWVKYPAAIVMINRYTGSLYTPGVPSNDPPPPGGGLTTIEIPMETYGSHCEHRLWATGFFSTDITVSADGFGEFTHPNGAKLDVARIDSEIRVGVGDAQLSAVVSASSYVHDNSAWG